MAEFDRLSRDEQRRVVEEHREVRRLVSRYGISESDATKLRLGILRGEIEGPTDA